MQNRLLLADDPEGDHGNGALLMSRTIPVVVVRIVESVASAKEKTCSYKQWRDGEKNELGIHRFS